MANHFRQIQISKRAWFTTKLRHKYYIKALIEIRIRRRAFDATSERDSALSEGLGAAHLRLDQKLASRECFDAIVSMVYFGHLGE